ncbi:CBS domain-containing protein [bacterium]|nr:CBS domain-containing protein [bacterium]
MPDNLIARDLMKLSFLRLGAGHTLHEALGILLDPQAREHGPRVLIVLNPDGSFAGVLTTRYLLKALLPEWVSNENEQADSADFEQRLLAAIQDKLNLRVADAMNRDVPVASPQDRLPHLIDLMQERRLDSIPVLDEGRVIGVIHITDVFNAAARLALSAQDLPENPSSQSRS